MVPSIVIQQYTDDCNIMLKRALLGKSISCFGSDGNGKYGQHYFARHYTILDVSCRVYADEDEQLHGEALIAPLGYSFSDHGHVATDKNLEISINKLFDLEYIDHDCWSWAPLEDQGSLYFTIKFDPNKLLYGTP